MEITNALNRQKVFPKKVPYGGVPGIFSDCLENPSRHTRSFHRL